MRVHNVDSFVLNKSDLELAEVTITCFWRKLKDHNLAFVMSVVSCRLGRTHFQISKRLSGLQVSTVLEGF